MSYSCLEELQTILDLHILDKAKVLSDAGCKCNNDGWFVVTDDGQCHLFDKDGNLDDISNVTSLKEGMIKKYIKKIIIPNSVTSIGDWVFNGHSSLKNVTIPDSVTSIGEFAFYGCSGLTSVTISNGVMNIESGAFKYCSSLTSVTFEDKTFEEVKTMKNYPFGIEDVSIIKYIDKTYIAA